MARAQLIELGMSASGVDAWVERERLQIVLRGVYSVGHELLTRHGRLMAAVLASGREAAVSHRTAASLWALLPDDRAAIDVTVPNRRRAKGRLVLHVSRLPRSYRTTVDGIPVTSVPRTLVDLAPHVPRWRLERAIEAAERRGIFDLAAVDELIAGGRSGCRRLRAALATARPDAITRSELERRFMELVRRAGLPLPGQNVYLHGHEVDAIWPDHRLVVELDGYEYHRTPQAFERDRRRDAELHAEGWTVLRFSWRQVVSEPETVVAALERTLTQPW